MPIPKYYQCIQSEKYYKGISLEKQYLIVKKHLCKQKKEWYQVR